MTYYQPDIPLKVSDLLRSCKTSCWIIAYALDELYLQELRALCSMPGFQLRVIVCLSRLKTRSPVTQPKVLYELMDEWKADVRCLCPKGGSYPCMHIKAMLLDGELMLHGSHNFTKNSANNAVEMLTVSRAANQVRGFQRYFAHLHDSAHEVGLDFLDELMVGMSINGQRNPSPGHA